MNAHTETPALDRYIKSRRKSVAVAFLLSLVFGPPGSIYGSPLGGAVLTLIVIVSALGGLGILAGVLGWLFAILLGPAGAADHNARVRAEAELMAGGAQ
jgi:hypothetical protein